MNILGINFSHDASVCLLTNGKIRMAIEEEKISRVKQDFGFPEKAINEILSKAGLKPADIDLIAFGSLFYSETGENEIRYRFTKDKKYKNKEVIDRITSYLSLTKKKISDANKAVFEDEIKKKGFSKAKIHFYQHHLSHAASAYYCAPFESDLVITCDGHGDGEAFNFYVFDEKQGLKCIHSNNYETSVGQFYSAITRLLGFRPTRHEGKITGLAAYGKEGPLVKKFSELFYYEAEQLRRFPYGKVEELWDKFGISGKLGLKVKVNLKSSESEIGRAYGVNSHILYAWLEETTKGHTKEDIAYACQMVTEQVVLKEVNRILEKHFPGKKVKVSLAGGVFANVRVNQEIYELPAVENIFVQPAMGDSGLAMGAAILADIEYGKRPLNTKQYNFTDTYWGPDFSADVPSFVKNLAKGFTAEEMAEPAKKIARLMADNKIVGFWHGAMEWGPRALGKRSMILNTFDRTVNDSLNQRLSRTEFMPFAPSVIDFMAKEYFPAFDPSSPAADYMTITYDVDPKHHEQLQAVVHVDGTARPQIVKKETNPYYYDIINEFYKITGCGAIVNTSFNAHEEPIVSTPEAAFKALKEDRIDYLVLENYLIHRN